MSKELHRVYKEYFYLLDRYFGQFAAEAKKHKQDAGVVARDVLSYPRFKEFFDSHSESLCQRLTEFWITNQECVERHVAQIGGLKARFGGDFGPQAGSGLLNRGGLYFDTIIVPDPMLRAARLDASLISDKHYYLLKYAINQLLMRDVYLADVTPPIAVIVPDKDLARLEPDMNELALLGQRDTVLVTNELFEKSFDTFEEVSAFFSRFTDIKHLTKEIVHPDLIWFDETKPRELDQQLDALVDNTRRNVRVESLPFDPESSVMLMHTLVGRMMQINDVYQRAVAQHAHPIISAPVSFHWLKWKLKLNQKAYDADIPASLDLNLTNAILSDDLEWLSDVPADSLVKLRTTGQLRDMRKLFREELSNLSSAAVNDVEEVTRQVDHNLSTALARHQSQVKDINRRLVSDMVVPGMSLLCTVGAAFVPAVYPDASQWVKAMTGTWGAFSLGSLYQKVNSYVQERRKLLYSPTGILWEARNSREDRG